jgi:hypothetical protein
MRTENANLHPILQRRHNSGAARGLPGLYGGFVQSIGGKDRRAVMRNLERISKAMTFDGVSASSTTSAKAGHYNKWTPGPNQSDDFGLRIEDCRFSAFPETPRIGSKSEIYNLKSADLPSAPLNTSR